MPTLLSLLGSVFGGFLFCTVAAFCLLLVSLLLGCAVVLYAPLILIGKVHLGFK